jgi:signal transduction histidine kinase
MEEKIPEVALIVIASTVLIIFLAGIVVFVLFIQQKRKYRHAQEKFLMKAEFEGELLRAKLELQEQTYDHISRDLHDNIGTMISLAMVNLDFSNLEQQKAHEHIANARKILDKAVIDLKDISKSMKAETIATQSLQESIQKELEHLTRSNYYEAAFDHTGVPISLEPEKKIILFRIFQECISNFIRHAQSKSIVVKLATSGGTVEMVIADKGVGFDTSAENSRSGLKNIRNRVKLIGGRLNIESSIGKGTRLSITAPVLGPDPKPGQSL